MRVITGSARGRRLRTLEGESVRPTTDKVKEAMFSMINPYLAGATVLDLFAGSGALGIEALSRGAAERVFSDKAKECYDIIKGNLEKTNFTGRGSVFREDFTGMINKFEGQQKFHVVLLDPPYMKGFEKDAIALISKKKIYAPGVVIVVEHSMEDILAEEIGDFCKIKDKNEDKRHDF